MKGLFMRYLYVKYQHLILNSSKDIAQVKVFFLEVCHWRRHWGHDNSSPDSRPGELKRFSNLELNIGNFHCFTILSFYPLTRIESNTWVIITICVPHEIIKLNFTILLKNWPQLIACNLKANIHRCVISNTRAHENRWTVAEDSNGISENERNRALRMLSARYRQQDVKRQCNARPSNISRLLSRFRVTWQVSSCQRHRRQQKTMVRQYRFKILLQRQVQTLHVCTQSCQ
jgi:hypothetical protein